MENLCGNLPTSINLDQRVKVRVRQPIGGVLHVDFDNSGRGRDANDVALGLEGRACAVGFKDDGKVMLVYEPSESVPSAGAQPVIVASLWKARSRKVGSAFATLSTYCWLSL